jgi:antitoxin MazE
MTVHLIRIGNSRGIRLPHELLHRYHLQDGAELHIEERREGLLIRIGHQGRGQSSWEDAYREMATDSAEREEWSDWDATVGDGGEG